MTKAEIRDLMRRRRQALNPLERAAMSLAIAGHLFADRRWSKCRSLLAYHAFPDEAATRPIIEEALEKGKAVHLPRCVPGERRFQAVRITDPDRDLVESGRLPGLWEPRPDIEALADPDTLDLVLTPGIAFDRSGYRVGFGAGMYDRFFSEAPQPRRLALAFMFQVVDCIPHEAHDIPMQEILTETGWLPVRAGS